MTDSLDMCLNAVLTQLQLQFWFFFAALTFYGALHRRKVRHEHGFGAAPKQRCTTGVCSGTLNFLAGRAGCWRALRERGGTLGRLISSTSCSAHCVTQSLLASCFPASVSGSISSRASSSWSRRWGFGGLRTLALCSSSCWWQLDVKDPVKDPVQRDGWSLNCPPQSCRSLSMIQSLPVRGRLQLLRAGFNLASSLSASPSPACSSWCRGSGCPPAYLVASTCVVLQCWAAILYFYSYADASSCPSTSTRSVVMGNLFFTEDVINKLNPPRTTRRWIKVAPPKMAGGSMGPSSGPPENGTRPTTTLWEY